MTRSNGHTLAVPQAALRHAGSSCSLVFESVSWNHFRSYADKLDRLPADFIAEASGVSQALGKVRRELRSFGSPAQVRQLLLESPQALSDELPPAMTYAGLVWWIKGLEASAGAVVSILQGLLELAGTSGDRKLALQRLGKVANSSRNRIAPLVASLNAFEAAILEANHGLSEACKAAGAMLQKTQETSAGLQGRIKRLELHIAELGLFGIHKKQQLLAQLHTQKIELMNSMARTNKLQAQLRALDTVLDEGVWLESGVGDVLDSLDKLRTAWTSFGSGVTQLAADASHAELVDPPWIEQALDRAEAIRLWGSLGRAAGDFAAASLVDFPDRRAR